MRVSEDGIVVTAELAEARIVVGPDGTCAYTITPRRDPRHRVRDETSFLSRSSMLENHSVWLRYVSTSRS